MSESSRGQTPRSSLSTSSTTSAATYSYMNGEPSNTALRVGSTNDAQYPLDDAVSSPRHTSQDGDRDIRRSEDGDEELNTRRQRPRRTGGFLLDASPDSRLEEGASRHSVRESGGDKGKGREDGSELSLRRGKTRHSAHRSKQSVGSSPLSVEITNYMSQEGHGLDGASSDTSKLYHQDSNVLDTQAENISTSMRKDLQTEPPSLDTDPAQIVRLALNLSESRRRHVSAARLSPIDSLGGNRRYLSSGQLGPMYPSNSALGTTNGSLRYALQQRTGSRNLSPRTAQLARGLGTPPVTKALENQNSTSEILVAPNYEIQILDNSTLSPSDATLLRAEKARTALELSYEYRRLLQYLPKLPVIQKSRPETAKGVHKANEEHSHRLGRCYNPLQYVRNRKVRTRERMTLDAEKNGWSDIERVRDWVNSIASHEPTLDGVPYLPSFVPVLSYCEENDLSTVSSLRRPNAPATMKASRPRTDWNITSWDLLADAYWLELDDHKKLIEDREGRKLYPNTIPQVEHHNRSSITQLLPRKSASIPRRNQSPEKVNVVVDKQNLQPRERGRPRHQLRGSVTSLQEYSSSQDRKAKWHRKLVRSQSSSSSAESPHGSLSRGPRLYGRGDSRDRQDSAVLERQVLDLLAKEADTIDWGDGNSIHGMQESADKPTGAGVSGGKYDNTGVSLSDEGNNGPKNEKIDLDDELPSTQADSRAYLIEERQPRISLEDPDTTAPSSPIDREVVPSIAINLSPPAFRSKSPSKPLPFPHRSLNYAHSRDRQLVGETDFARPSKTPIVLAKGSMKTVDDDKEASSTPNAAFLSPKKAEGFSRVLRHRGSDSKSLKELKDQKGPQIKTRGLLKSSKLAGFVGNPVSKVGDFLRRRDQFNLSPDLSSPISSYASEASGTDEDLAADETHNIRLTQSTNDLPAGAQSNQKPVNGAAPKYHMSNLPSFVSAPKRTDENEQSRPEHFDVDDHVGRQQLASRLRGRAGGFDRLAPLNLDLDSVSRSRSPSLSRIKTHESNLTESRQPSISASDTSRQPSDRRLSTILGLPGKIGLGGPPVTGLASLETHSRTFQDRFGPEGDHQWSMFVGGAPVISRNVTQKDIIRVRALLLSSGVKAKEILRRFDSIPLSVSPMLQNLQPFSATPLQPLSRSKEHIFAARLLVKNIDGSNVALRRAANEFSQMAIGSFHEQLSSLESRISKSLTPRLRASADEADALSTELATSFRLSVKQLNDNIDHILRRKRRRFRWIRNSGYLLLEWVLLGAMWWVWLVVVLVRLAMGTVGTLWRIGRWLLWL